MLRYGHIISFLVLSLLPMDCRSDIAIVAGVSQTSEGGSNPPSYALVETFSVENPVITLPSLPTSDQSAIYGVAIDPLRGTVVYVGEYLSVNQHISSPLIWTGSVVSETITSVLAPSTAFQGALGSVAIDSTGTAVICGLNTITQKPLIYTLAFGASSPTLISLPNTDQGILDIVVIGANNTAVMAGGDTTTNTPLIYLLFPGATEATPVSIPDPSIQGQIYAAATLPDGTVLLGGIDNGNNQSLIYKLSPGSLAATAISIPGSNDGSQVDAIACTSDGTATLVGSVGIYGTYPLIYTIAPGSSSASNVPVTLPDNNNGYYNAVAIGSNNVAVLGGYGDTTELPLISTLDVYSQQVTNIESPNSNSGAIFSIAINDTNTAFLTGTYYDTGGLALFTLAPSSTSASAIITPDVRYTDSGYGIAIYNCDGPFDLRLIRAYYYLQLIKTKNRLAN